MSETVTRPGVVVDCMVFVQAAANEKSPAARIFDLLDEGKITLYVSKLILAEVRHVLNRPEVRASLKRLTDVAIEALFERLEQNATLIKQVPTRFIYPRDPKDEPYINLAVEMKADYLVSRDNDLLDLMKWKREEGREFQKRFRFLKIVTPESFLAVMESEEI
ncbi:MAG: putative toxin-antitoxin system toxin component, PIN family [Acidobacteria bacterium]|nr:putative toxin-antitoxin system toxin component, PIN family [Acidobacteriota bacterium]